MNTTPGNVVIYQEETRGTVASAALRILRREIQARGGVETTLTDNGSSADIIICVSSSYPADGFAIEDHDGSILIRGNDERGLLYGVGRFLHTCSFDLPVNSSPERLFPMLSQWRGTSAPDCLIRGLYPAYNFKNWYVAAPRSEVLRYMEELALWGLNTLVFAPAHYQFATLDTSRSPELNKVIEENIHLIAELRRLGFQIGLLVSGNYGFAYGPPDGAATDVPDTSPPRRGNVGPRLCCSKPSAFAHMERTYAAVLDDYRSVGLDYLVTFPYDAGGCGCKECWPWGSRGFLKLNKMIHRLVSARFPECKLVYGTWCFDARGDFEGDWRGLARELEKDAGWVDFIMADSHEDFPHYPLEQGIPGGLPLLNFPEISMWGRYPWGGYGANPLPARLERLWYQIRHACAGGFPYSEGIFEDINKIICAGFYWNRNAKALDILREYISYEFSRSLENQLTTAIGLLERTYPQQTRQPEDVEAAWRIISEADSCLPQRARKSWRWQILYLRALIDHELLASQESPHSDKCDQAFEELTAIYHAENAGGPDAPPSRRCKARLASAAQTPPPGASQ